MRRLSFIFLILFVSLAALAQTTVTGTIKDANGNAYANGTASAYLAVVNGQPTSSSGPVATNAGGLFTLTLTSGSWTFTICAPPINIGPKGNPTPTQVCFSSSPISISGSSQDVSAQLNAIAPLLGPGGGGGGAIPSTLTPENFGAVGNGVTNDCAAFTSASAVNNFIYLTSGHTYAFGSNCTVSAQINPTNNNQLIVNPGVTLTLNQPPNTGGAAIPVFTLQSTLSVTDTMQRANENPMSDGGQWTACTGLGAGQLTSNLYEGTVAGTAVGVCWTNGGSFPANQISTVTINTDSTSSDLVCAIARATTATNNYYNACVTGPLGGSATVSLGKVVTGTPTTLLTCVTPPGIFAGDNVSVGVTGSSPATLTGYLNGAAIPGCSATDSSLTTGFPGMIVRGNAAIANGSTSFWAGQTLDAGIVRFNGNTNSILPEWFGAKGDNATDDSVALQACLNSAGNFVGNTASECFLAPKTYLANSTLNINTAVMSLRGAPVGAYGPAINTTKTTLTQIQVAGQNTSFKQQYNSLQDFTLNRAASATGKGTGVYVNFAQWTHITRVNSFDAVRGIYFDSGNANTFNDDLIVANLHGTPVNQVGFTYNGAQNSSRSRDAIYIGSGTGMTLTGATDTFVLGFESAGANPGMSITGAIGDLHIERAINDSCSGPCLNITATGFVEILDSYSAASQPNVILMTGATGIHFLGGVVNVNGGASPNAFLLQSSSSKNQISGMHINMAAGTGNPTAINITSSPTNVLTDNMIVGTVMNVGVQLATSPNSTLTGNILTGTGNNGFNITLDSTPSEIANNIIDPTSITNTFIGAGEIPTISAGFNAGASVVAGSQGPRSFTINVGTPAGVATGTIGLPTARHGWSCSCTDTTTNSSTVFACKQTGAGTTTTAPIGEFTAAGAAQAWTASDILAVSCQPF